MASMMERTLSFTDVMAGYACEAVFKVLPRTLTPELLQWEVEDLGEIAPECAAADARKVPDQTPPQKKTDAAVQEALPAA